MSESDIVERLLELAVVECELACECDCPPEATANYRYAKTCEQAADEIARLRAENEKLRAALLGANTALAAVDAFEHDFRHIIGNTNTEIWKMARVNVRAALEGK